MRFLFCICIILLCSCEKNINFNLDKSVSSLVVDGSIENGKPPIIVLSNSFDYFSQITPQLLSNSFVHNAEMFISDGAETNKLTEYVTDSSGFKFYYYSIDTSTGAKLLIGKFNTSYNLKVIIGSNTYFASTTIPSLAKKPDSLWWKPAPYNADTNNVVVMVKATDPPGLGNYIRYYTQRNNGPFLPGINSVYDDQVIDGSTYDIGVEPGIDRNYNISYNFRRGDSVTLKLCNIDKSTYKFWMTMEFAYQSIGNPFASPNKVVGNVSNGALGAFCGYAASYKTIIIPD